LQTAEFAAVTAAVVEGIASRERDQRQRKTEGQRATVAAALRTKVQVEFEAALGAALEEERTRLKHAHAQHHQRVLDAAVTAAAEPLRREMTELRRQLASAKTVAAQQAALGVTAVQEVEATVAAVARVLSRIRGSPRPPHPELVDHGAHRVDGVVHAEATAALQAQEVRLIAAVGRLQSLAVQLQPA
jgi:hypothetical protein